MSDAVLILVGETPYYGTVGPLGDVSGACAHIAHSAHPREFPLIPPDFIDHEQVVATVSMPGFPKPRRILFYGHEPLLFAVQERPA